MMYPIQLSGAELRTLHEHYTLPRRAGAEAVHYFGKVWRARCAPWAKMKGTKKTQAHGKTSITGLTMPIDQLSRGRCHIK